jgi:uncharacterized protein
MRETQLQATGLENDRRWMLVDPQGRFVSQRECPEMARLVPQLVPQLAPQIGPQAKLEITWANTDGATRPQAPRLTVPIFASETHDTAKGLSLRTVQVWSYTGDAQDCGHEASNFLSEHLQRPVRLVQFLPSQKRDCSQTITHFADGYPVLVLGENSAIDVYQRLHQGRTPDAAQLQGFIERFRPNVVISGLPAYDEDFVQSLTGAGQDILGLVKPCPRCSIPSLDPNSGRPTLIDPTRELATYRYHAQAEGAVLGMNAIPLTTHENASHRLHVGQVLEAVYDFA